MNLTVSVTDIRECYELRDSEHHVTSHATYSWNTIIVPNDCLCAIVTTITDVQTNPWVIYGTAMVGYILHTSLAESKVGKSRRFNYSKIQPVNYS